MLEPVSGDYQLEGVTRNTLLKRFLRDTGLGVYGTATGGSTSSIIDTNRLLSSQYNTDQYEGGWFRISKDASGPNAAPEGSIRAIDNYDPGTGTITTQETLSAVAADDEYEIWRYPHPQDVLDTLDTTLQQDILLPTRSVLSEIPDFDMEASGVTNWSVANATRAKATAAAEMNGKQYLRVTNTAINGYAASVQMRVEPGKSYRLMATCRTTVVNTTARLYAWDDTNNAAIASRDTIRRHSTRLAFDFTVPAGCYLMSVLLAGLEAGAINDWDDVVLYPQEAHTIALPWWVRNRNQILAVGRLRENQVASDVYEPDLIGDLTNEWDIVDSAFGRGQLRLTSIRPSLPAFIVGLRPESAYADDNVDTKFVDENYLIVALKYRVFETLANSSGPLERGWVDAHYEQFRKDYEQYARNFFDSVTRVSESTRREVWVGGNEW